MIFFRFDTSKKSNSFKKVLSAVLTITLISSVSVSLTGCSAKSKASKRVLRPAYGTLEELFQTEIVSIGLEELGYTLVSGTEVEYDTIHQAIAIN